MFLGKEGVSFRRMARPHSPSIVIIRGTRESACAILVRVAWSSAVPFEKRSPPTWHCSISDLRRSLLRSLRLFSTPTTNSCPMRSGIVSRCMTESTHRFISVSSVSRSKRGICPACVGIRNTSPNKSIRTIFFFMSMRFYRVICR